MCGRFVITSAPEALRQLFGYVEQPNFPSRYNIAPTQPVPVIIADQGEGHFRLMRWGLMPAWVKDPRKFALLINARSESVLDKPAFKNAIKRRRCLIPADGYYEWHVDELRKRAYFIHRIDGTPFGFAALAETWSGPNGEEVDTVAIVTAAARGGLATLHHRVPVEVRPEDFARWLDCRNVDALEAADLLHAPRDGDFTWHEISTRVNAVANDDAQLVLPITDAQRDAETPKRAARRTKAASSGDDGQGRLF